MSAAASLSSARYADTAARQGALDARLGRPLGPFVPAGRRQAAAYRAAYRAVRAAQAA